VGVDATQAYRSSVDSVRWWPFCDLPSLINHGACAGPLVAGTSRLLPSRSLAALLGPGRSREPALIDHEPVIRSGGQVPPSIGHLAHSVPYRSRLGTHDEGRSLHTRPASWATYPRAGHVGVTVPYRSWTQRPLERHGLLTWWGMSESLSLIDHD
jgi:hypothetical protein